MLPLWSGQANAVNPNRLARSFSSFSSVSFGFSWANYSLWLWMGFDWIRQKKKKKQSAWLEGSDESCSTRRKAIGRASIWFCFFLPPSVRREVKGLSEWFRIGIAQSNFFLRFSRIRVNLLLYESKTTHKRGQYYWRAEKNLDGWTWFPNPSLWPIPYTFTRWCYNLGHCCRLQQGRSILDCPLPSKFFLALQSFFICLSVVLLSYDSRSTLIRLDRRKNLVELDLRWTFY